MKNKMRGILVAAVVAIIYLLPTAAKAQISCPYMIKNNRPCDICVNYEVRLPGGGGPCPTVCSGPVCIPPGGIFKVPCCGANVIVTLVSINGVAISPSPNVEGPGTCVPAIFSVSGSAPGGCGSSTYNMTWTSSITNIN